MRTCWLGAPLLLVAACTSTPPPPAAPRTLLRGPDCLDPTQARSWDDVTSTVIHVDAGRRRYRITVPPGCVPIGQGPTLRFDGDPISGRVCGGLGDALLLDGGVRCTIDRIELLDDAEDPPATE